MCRQWSWIASGLVTVALSGAVAIAQPPGGNSADPAVAPDSSYLSDADRSYFDHMEIGWQYRFQADWVALKRTNRADDLPAMIGPDAFRLKDLNFNYQSGYRLNLGFMNEDYELEGSYLQLDGLTGSRTGTLTKGLVFDGQATYFDPTTSAAARLAIDPLLAPNFLSSTGTLFSPLSTAANTNIPGTDESTELEFLRPGATYAMRYDSTLQDFDVNFKGRKQSGRLLRFGMGYRNIQFQEAARVEMRGLFDTVDVDDGLEPDPNDSLSDTALTGAGLVSSGGGFTDTVPPPGPLETLIFTNDLRANNQLNGIQGTMDAMFFESDYFELGGFGRAGVFHNRASVSLSERYLDVTSGGSYSRSFRDEKDGLAFAGNVGISGLWIVRQNFRVFASYEAMYLAGVALAPNQSSALATDIAGNVSMHTRMNGSAFFHGGRIGIEILLP